MGVKNARLSIKEARTKAGLTQEQLSEGICSQRALSLIERGQMGVSPSTFQALMEHAGAPSQIFPVFENWTDYECFFHLSHARFHLNAWQLEPAYAELQEVERLSWNHNKFYYQEWLLLYGKLQYRSGNADHHVLYEQFLYALRISRPEIHLDDFTSLLLSIHEIELLTAIAQEAIELGDLSVCLSICEQLESYLESCQFTYLEKDRLVAEMTIPYVRYLLHTKAYQQAFAYADKARHTMVKNVEDSPLFELNFLTALGYYYMGDADTAMRMFKDSFYSAHAIKSPFAAICRRYLCDRIEISLPDFMLSVPDITLQTYPLIQFLDASLFNDGTYDINSNGIVTIGKLIQTLRQKEKVSQPVLCQGLCSVSKLSKIENGSLQPEVILAETLLQRLGFSEREFSFWGNDKEAKFDELKFQLIRKNTLSAIETEHCIQSLSETINNRNLLYKQFFEYILTCQMPASEDKIQRFHEVLSYTLKDFQIHNINNYRLSWIELTILNLIAFTYIEIQDFKNSLSYFRRIIEYCELHQPDILFQTHIFTITLYQFAHALYMEKYFKELTELINSPIIAVSYSNITYLGGFYFYYVQALGCFHNFDTLLPVARYTHALYNIYERFANANHILNSLYNDFAIHIDY